MVEFGLVCARNGGIVCTNSPIFIGVWLRNMLTLAVDPGDWKHTSDCCIVELHDVLTNDRRAQLE